MRILFSSPDFYPSEGIIPTVTETLAEQFCLLGHKVAVLTQTEEDGPKKLSFGVLRCPSRQVLFRAVTWCDLYLQTNFDLKTAWPLFIVRRPSIVIHRTWVDLVPGWSNWREHLKAESLRNAHHITISRNIADQIPMASQVVGDPYDETLYREIPGAIRDKQLIFAGRLIPETGVSCLLQALAILQGRGMKPSLTIVGTGPERGLLQAQVKELNLHDQVTFLGAKEGSELVELLNGHQIMVIPPLIEEPFSIRALEALACGCVVVGSDQGGLKDSIGQCGVTFPNGDAEQLASGISMLLLDPVLAKLCRAEVEQHLARFTRPAVAKSYVDTLWESLYGASRLTRIDT